MIGSMMKSKIHRATVTDANLNYVGSVTIDRDLLEASDIYPYEQVCIWNVTNGERFETYAIPAPRGSGGIVLNGATAHRGKPGDRLTIMSFAALEPREAATWEPRVIVLGEHNRIVVHRGI